MTATITSFNLLDEARTAIEVIQGERDWSMARTINEAILYYYAKATKQAVIEDIYAYAGRIALESMTIIFDKIELGFDSDNLKYADEQIAKWVKRLRYTGYSALVHEGKELRKRLKTLL